MKVIKFRYLACAFFSFLIFTALSGCKLIILEPQGVIASAEKNILLTAFLLMLIVVIPVIMLSLVIAFRYREGNNKADYSPDWAHSTILEIVWWTIPCIIIAILAVITWNSTHSLDPYKPLNSKDKPLIIYAMSLEWKWLFIYPEQKIAALNFVQFPINKPIRFYISAEGPMNSFQIPQLAGQIYAMAGMKTKLNLIANSEGDYQGLATNFSGDGFSEMKFIARVSSESAFNEWVNSVRESTNILNQKNYDQLIKPSENNPITYFSYADSGVFERSVMKAMMPLNQMKTMQHHKPHLAIEIKRGGM